MAFKILSTNEIDLLTENQRTQYEDELAIYNGRVKFVEQLDWSIQIYGQQICYVSCRGIDVTVPFFFLWLIFSPYVTTKYSLGKFMEIL